SAQIREILINESAWEEMTCLFAPSLDKTEAHKSLHWIARLCASLECDMFDNKKLAQEDKNHLALMLCLRSLILSK
ncbi:hypothetical protein, partial [Escherichia coli]